VVEEGAEVAAPTPSVGATSLRADPAARESSPFLGRDQGSVVRLAAR
jgi:hypothetical protein